MISDDDSRAANEQEGEKNPLLEPGKGDSVQETLEKVKLQREVRKLAFDIWDLKFQISKRGRAFTLAWPIVSGSATLVLAIVLGITSIVFQNRQMNFQKVVTKTQEDFLTAQAQRDQYKILVSILEDATDATKGADKRIAGVWTLDTYWHDRSWRQPQYENDLANTLSVLLITDRSENSKYDDSYAIRLAASLVIGDAIQKTDMEDDRERVERLATLLYGRRGTWETGCVVRQNWFLKHHKDIPDYSSKLWAVEEAIRWNWEYLQGAHLAGAELPGIQLYWADLRRAYLAEANLQKADLHGADFEEANLDGANLKQANLENANLNHTSLKNTKEWQTVNIVGANIKYVEASAEFKKWAKAQGAVEIETDEWRRRKQENFRRLP